MLVTQIKYDLKMFFREMFYLVFSVALPPAGYLVMGQIFGNETYGEGLNYAQTYTPTFIVMISFSVIFFAFGFDQVANRATGVEKRLLVTPVTSTTLLLSAISRVFIIVSTGFFMILIIGIIAFNLTITATGFLPSYLGLLAINALLLVYATALYSPFKELKSALVTSLILFQFVLFTGGFAMPIERMPNFIQIAANLNPMYHINQIYIALWNQNLVFDQQTLLSFGYLLLLLVVSTVVIRLVRNRKE